MTTMQLVFLLIGAITLLSAIIVVSSPRLVHAALWLILVLAGVAALFVLLEATFLAVVQVAVYIGAIAILIIFAVMLTRRVMTDSGPQVNSNWWAAAAAALLLFGALLALFSQVHGLAATSSALAASPEAILDDLGQALVDVNRYVLPFEVASVLLLAAMIGAIVIARPSVRSTDEGGEQ
jgi:NADH-quinone oxidoreductase subunit J